MTEHLTSKPNLEYMCLSIQAHTEIEKQKSQHFIIFFFILRINSKYLTIVYNHVLAV